MDENYKEVLFDKYCPTCAYKKVSEEAWPCSECIEHMGNLYSKKPVNYINEKDNEIVEKPRLLDPISKVITHNGVYHAKEEGLIGYSTVEVNVRLNLQNNKTVTPTTFEQKITADGSFTGLKAVTVEAVPVATTEEVRMKFRGTVNG